MHHAFQMFDLIEFKKAWLFKHTAVGQPCKSGTRSQSMRIFPCADKPGMKGNKLFQMHHGHG